MSAFVCDLGSNRPQDAEKMAERWQNEVRRCQVPGNCGGKFLVECVRFRMQGTTGFLWLIRL